MLVSVVIPAYNEEKYLPKTLGGVNCLEKKGFDIEVLVVDGGSTDNTVEVAKKQGARVISVEHGTIGMARHEGVNQAKGEIVAMTDADSDVPKDWLIKHIDILKRKEAIATFGPYKVYNNGKRTLFSLLINNRYFPMKFIPDSWKLLYASGQNIVFWKDKALKIGNFDKKLRVMEDVDFVLRMAKIGKVLCLPDVVVMSSPRRADEGLSFFVRGTKTAFDYFIFKKKDNLQLFPDIR